MRLTALAIVLLLFANNLFSQGITLLYKGGGSGGWNDASNWIQINTPAGQTPIQRAPTELDDVVFSKVMSGLNQAGFGLGYDTLMIGSTSTSKYTCRSLQIHGMNIEFHGHTDYAGAINIYTKNGGQLLIDSSGNLSDGILTLHGGNKNIYDLEIKDSKYGKLFSHAVWSSIVLKPEARARFINSSIETWKVSSYPTGGEIYAEGCSFMTPSFVLGNSSKATILDCKISDGNNFVTLGFGIGRDSDFTSHNVEITAHSILSLYTSGSTLNGNITTRDAQGGLKLMQAEPEHPLPNIINGNLRIFGQGIDLSGGLKLSGDLINYAHELDMSDTSRVYMHGQHIFKIGGIANYGNNTTLDNCTKPGCHFSLEFFGDKDSKFVWPVGMPIDTLIIKKSNCAKVSFQNSLYVSGETRIESGQLLLDPNPNIPYKFVCVGDITIAKGGGIFLRRNSNGVVANMAVGGIIKDQNTAKDSTCAGLSNPYMGTIFNENFTGITLLYKSNNSGGWNNSSNWIQINTPVGRAPIQRVPTELDHVVFSKSMSSLSGAGIVVEKLSDSITVGINRTSGIRCRSMRISNMSFGVSAKDFDQYYPRVLVSTANGGYVLIDSNSVIEPADFYLQGGNAAIYDLQILNSSYGAIKAHNREMGSIAIGSNGRAKMVNTTYGSFFFQTDSTSELYAENCSFNVNGFKIGASSKATLLNCSITDYGASLGSLVFGIGPNADFTSSSIEIKPFKFGQVYTSGSVLKGDINVMSEGGLYFTQHDPANPLPNIIDGNANFVSGQMKVKGSLRLSGNLINNAIDLLMNYDTSHVYINGQHIFTTAGISSYGNTVDQNCTGDHCRFKLELFGDRNTEVVWPVGFPVDTLIINKSNCAKVTFRNSLYVAGETRILIGQLALDPNDTIPYKLVSAGDINISPGGSLFLRRNSDGVTANLAIGGAINDQNAAVDTTCTGFANPYNGTVGFYSGQQNVALKPLAIRSNTTVDNITLHGDPGTNFFLEKDVTVKQFRFAGQASLFLGNHSLTVTDSLLNFSPSSYIITNGTGKLRRNNVGSKETIFPIGPAASSYNPLTITNAGTVDDFSVSVRPTVYVNGTSGTAITDRAVDRTWHVEEKTTGGSNATIKLQWKADNEQPGFVRTAAYLSHFTAGKWDDSTPTTTEGTDPFSITRSSLTSFSPFTVFSSIVSSVSGPAAQQVQIFPNPARDYLYVQLPMRLTATTLQVVNSIGAVVSTNQARAGATLATVNIADLPAGFYSLTIRAGIWHETRKFIKQ
ncbi:MAG TPA: T9SS type A sorting domain-containing protein [Flavisolibacter sp.]|jgi:hypothetical protein|nr:T9SS type A sorting domain-containing protein [Flavisolibacter sp.]